MSAHTPGPWKAVYVGCGDWDLSGPTTREDWTLAAAAPDLLEALKRMASIIDKLGDMPDGFIHPSPWQTLQCEEALEQALAAIKAVEENT